MHHYDKDRDARDKLKDHPYYDACVKFCAHWDQVSFDPNYDTYPLEHFIPMLKEVFSKEPASFI
jgi:predicted HD phosphohydrolase